MESSQFCDKVNTALKTPATLFAFLLLFAFVTRAPLPAGEAVRLYDFGADEIAYLSLPNQAPKGSILLIPDALGVPEVVAARCDLLAKLGYVAMTVDFYNGQVAKSLEQAEPIQNRVSALSAQKTITAAMSLLTESPAYRTDRLIVAVWGRNMEFVRAVRAERALQKQPFPLVALSWLEPDGPVDGDPFSDLPRPLQVLANNGPWMGDWEKIQAKQPLKRIPADLHPYNAKPGFLLKEETEPLAAQAWVAIIEFWKKATEGSLPATETPETIEEPPVPAPAKPAPKKSGILPKR